MLFINETEYRNDHVSMFNTLMWVLIYICIPLLSSSLIVMNEHFGVVNVKWKFPMIMKTPGGEHAKKHIIPNENII